MLWLQAVADAGTAGSVDPLAAIAPLLSDPEVAAAAQKFMESKDAGVLAGMGALLYLVNLLFRKGVFKKLPPGKVSDFVNSKKGGWIINIALAVGGGAMSMFGAGTPISIGSVISMLLKAGVAAGVAVAANELQKDVSAAKTAGEAAAKDPGPSINA